MEDRFSGLRGATAFALLKGPGQTASELRQAIATGHPPEGLVYFIDKIRSQAWTVTAADIDALRSCYTEDELFEIILAAAFGAADDRLRAARRALDVA